MGVGGVGVGGWVLDGWVLLTGWSVAMVMKCLGDSLLW